MKNPTVPAGWTRGEPVTIDYYEHYVHISRTELPVDGMFEDGGKISEVITYRQMPIEDIESWLKWWRS
jgi:hypothetical protein